MVAWCKQVWEPDSMKCMHMISRDRNHSEGQGVGVNCRLEPFQKFICFGTLEKFFKEALQQFIWISNWAQYIWNWSSTVDYQGYTWKWFLHTSRPSIVQLEKSFSGLASASKAHTDFEPPAIPDICHFFTRAKFLANKIYTEKSQFFALNL